MEPLVKDFWIKLEVLLEKVARQLLNGHAGLKFQIGNSSNSAFPLRAYLTILRSNEGEELSVTVDIRIRERGLLIDSDVIGEDGLIIVDGPSLKLEDDLPDPEVQVKLDNWFRSFELLFLEKSADIEAAIKLMECGSD